MIAAGSRGAARKSPSLSPRASVSSRASFLLASKQRPGTEAAARLQPNLASALWAS